MLDYRISSPIDPERVAALRLSVGWNAMRESLGKLLPRLYLHIGCYDGDELVGFLGVVSDGVCDAYIQDVMVRPDYQRRGIGTSLVGMAVERLKQNGVYAISLLFEAHNADFYRKFGFHIMMGGQMTTREEA